MNTSLDVLFVDRDQGEYLLLADLLARVPGVDYRLSWHPQLDDVADRILAGDFDLVLLDYYWGEQTVRDLLNSVRVQAGATPIVVMTDTMDPVVDATAIRAGAADYVVKNDIDPERFERVLRYAIERKAAEQHLTRLAHYDPLTDIPNRILFADRLEHAIRLADRDRTAFTLMFVDLDGFKRVNDSFGHEVGDAVIRICAERLQLCLRRSDSVARMGGDEFTLLLENLHAITDVAHTAEKVIEVLSAPLSIGGYDIRIGCSIGIALYPEAGGNSETLLKSADLAMYRAKAEEGDSFCFYTGTMDRQVHRQLSMERDLQRALRDGQLSLDYQPRVEAASGRPLAVEALVRWHHPQHGRLAAAEFVRLAEDTGMIAEIGYWVLEQVCRNLHALREAAGGALSASVNLSVRQFADEQLVPRVADILRQWEVPAGDLVFDLSERGFNDQLDRVSLCMRPLSYLGVGFALDDFGTGRCDLSALQRLPIGAVKIDSRFIAQLRASRPERRLVSTMIGLAHSLGKTVVAEGVESEPARRWLVEAGCDQLQGYHLAAPADLHTTCQWLARSSVR